MSAATAATGAHDARFIGDLMGSYVLASRAQSLSSVQVFACRARSISVHDAVVHAPVAGERGEALTMSFEPLGILRGTIERHVEGGFVVAFALTEAERTTLGQRIAWLKRRVLKAVDDRRQHRRVLPRQPRTRLRFGADRSIEALIIDMSQSGVAVSADVMPPVGTPLAVGSVAGRVVRQLPNGFAVQFDALQQLDQLEGLLALPKEGAPRLAALRLGLDGRPQPG